VLAKLNVGRPQYLIVNVCETHYPYYDGAYDPHFSPYRLHGFAAQMRAAAADQAVTIPTYDDALLSVLRRSNRSATSIPSFRGCSASFPQTPTSLLYHDRSVEAVSGDAAAVQ
jgi:hypothetical protein